MWTGLPVQDGRVEGCALSSCERTTVATSCWTTIDRRTLEPTKKTPHIQRQRSFNKMVGGAQSWSNQIPYPRGGWPSDWRTIIPKKFSHYCESSELHVRLSNLGIWQRDWVSPENLALSMSGVDYRPSRRLRETKTPVLKDTHTILCTWRPRGEEQGPHRRLKQNALLVLEGLLQRCGSQGVHHKDGGTGRAPLA